MRHAIHHALYCAYDERTVKRDEIATGYEVEKGKYVLIEPAELKKLPAPSCKAMEIVQFVKLSDVDPIYFETSYSTVPKEAGRRAYALLLRTMEENEIRPYRKSRCINMDEPQSFARITKALNTFYYANEVNAVKEYGRTSTKDLCRQEITLGEQFAKRLVRPFRPAEFHMNTNGKSSD